jgi:uncharacterized protein (DUF1778 family)
MKTASLNIRIDEGDRDILRVAAEAAHSSVSDFVRAAALQTADRILSDRRRFVIDDAAWVEYQRALDAPAEIRPELVELFSEPDLFA